MNFRSVFFLLGRLLLAPPAKLLFVGMMITGRLELYTVLVVLFIRPRRWKR